MDPQFHSTSALPHRYDIVRANAHGKTIDEVPALRPGHGRTTLPDPSPLLRTSHNDFRWRPVIFKATVNEEQDSIKYIPIDLDGRNERNVGTGAGQARVRRTAEVRGGAPQAIEMIAMGTHFRATPHIRSLPIFDQILRAPPPLSNFHPVHATKFARRIVLAKTALIVDLYLRQTYSLTVKAMQNISNIADFDPRRLGEKPWQDEWRSEFFNRLWELRGNIELLGFDMGNAIRLFSKLANEKSWPEMQNLGIADGRRWSDDRRSGHIKIRDQDQDDLEEWEHLEGTRKYAAGFIERTTNSYLQAASAEGAKFSNVQARTYVLPHRPQSCSD